MHVDRVGVTRHPVEIETAVYFACVEAMQNANKHAAGATGLWISLREEDRLRVEIRDDGPGFVPPRSRPAVACATCATASRRWVGS